MRTALHSAHNPGAPRFALLQPRIPRLPFPSLTVPFRDLQHRQAEAGRVQLAGVSLEAEGFVVHGADRAQDGRSPLALDEFVVIHQRHFDKHTCGGGGSAQCQWAEAGTSPAPKVGSPARRACAPSLRTRSPSLSGPQLLRPEDVTEGNS